MSNRKWTHEARKTMTMMILLCVLPTECFTVSHRVHKPCKYWCRVGEHEHKYYCCPSGKSDSWLGHGWSILPFPWFWLGLGGTTFGSHPRTSWSESPSTIAAWKTHCPPLRAHCPRSNEWHAAPTFCEWDSDCHGWEKCCYDSCLEHKTCKPAE